MIAGVKYKESAGFLLGMCAGVNGCVQVCIQEHTSVCTRRCQMPRSVTSFSISGFDRRSLTESRTTPSRILLFPPRPCWDSRVHMICQDFYMGVGDLNSCLHIRAALPTEPSLQSLNILAVVTSPMEGRKSWDGSSVVDYLPGILKALSSILTSKKRIVLAIKINKKKEQG